MYSRTNLNKVLIKNLEVELGSILFYAKNISSLDYKKNKKKVDSLINGSLKHTTKMVKLICANAPDSNGLKKVAVKRALKEEIGMREVYLYEANKLGDKKVVKELMKISSEEVSHEKIVRSLK